MMRALGQLVLTMLVLTALALIALYLTLGAIAMKAVETQATATLNLPTSVRTVTVRPFGSKAIFNQFRIASPAGFTTPDILIVPSAEMDISILELRNKPVHIESITRWHPRLVIEGNGIDLNLKQLVERIPAAVHPVHLVIDRVTVQDATVMLHNLPGITAEVTVPVETFTLNGLGADNAGGILLKDALIRLVTSLAVHAGNSPQMPASYRAWLTGDVCQMVRNAIPGQVGQLLSAMLGGDDRQSVVPRTRKRRGLLGLDSLLGPAASASSSRPAE
jgi:hypothetical protein